MSDKLIALSGQVGYASGAVYAWYFQGLIPDKAMLVFIEGMEQQGLDLSCSVLADTRRFILRRDEERKSKLRVASIHDNGI